MVESKHDNANAKKIFIMISNDEDSSNNVSITNKNFDYYPGIQGCRSIEEFERFNRIEEGTYGVVYRAFDKRTKDIVALKRLKLDENDGFPITSLREINTLIKAQHPNIISVREIVFGSDLNKIYIVMDYVEHDLKSLMDEMKSRKQKFSPAEIKYLTKQLMSAVRHLHDNWILHRDLKSSNLLLSQNGILKIADFGLAREYGSPLRKYTPVVVTRWYRAPELLLGLPLYSTSIDIWSVGCIFAEFWLMSPYLKGQSDIDQLKCIFKELGTPNEKTCPGYNELPIVKNVFNQMAPFIDYSISNLSKRFQNKMSIAGISLLQGLLTYDPKKRFTAKNALKHNYFKEQPSPAVPNINDKSKTIVEHNNNDFNGLKTMGSMDFELTNVNIQSYITEDPGFFLKF